MDLVVLQSLNHSDYLATLLPHEHLVTLELV